jgi:uncharacterized protein YcfJ
METITKSPTRIHPLMAAAAVSVIVLSAAGTAALTGLLPSSHGAAEPAAAPAGNPYATVAPAAAMPVAPAYTAPVQAGYAVPVQVSNGAQPPAAYAAPAQYAAPVPVAVPVATTYVQPAPAARPAVHKTVSHARPVHHYTETARRDDPGYYAQPAPPAVRQPNYLAIGTGALIGGVLGNQVGGGNGRKLATVAGIIGGGMLGNQIANNR